MPPIDMHPTRRLMLGFVAAATVSAFTHAWATDRPLVTVHKDPNCGCCSGWAKHLEQAGYMVKVIDTTQLDSVKTRLGVPTDLAACHTAEVLGYVVEGHVPAKALTRFLAEKPNAKGLAVAGMPIGSPGMEGGEPEAYDVVLFELGERRAYMRFVGEREI